MISSCWPELDWHPIPHTNATNPRFTFTLQCPLVSGRPAHFMRLLCVKPLEKTQNTVRQFLDARTRVYMSRTQWVIGWNVLSIYWTKICSDGAWHEAIAEYCIRPHISVSFYLSKSKTWWIVWYSYRCVLDKGELTYSFVFISLACVITRRLQLYF